MGQESPFHGGANSLTVHLPLTRLSIRYQHVRHLHTNVMLSCAGYKRLRCPSRTPILSSSSHPSHRVFGSGSNKVVAASIPPLIQGKVHTKPKALKILQFNCNGLSKKMPEILCFMEKQAIQIAALQETKLTDKSTATTTPNHTFIRCDRKRDKGGGLEFMIHESIPFSTQQPPQPDGVMETQSIKIATTDSELIITNVYIPLQSSYPQDYKASIAHLIAP